jgi:hypothetical protein
LITNVQAARHNVLLSNFELSAQRLLPTLLPFALNLRLRKAARKDGGTKGC